MMTAATSEINLSHDLLEHEGHLRNSVKCLPVCRPPRNGLSGFIDFRRGVISKLAKLGQYRVRCGTNLHQSRFPDSRPDRQFATNGSCLPESRVRPTELSWNDRRITQPLTTNCDKHSQFGLLQSWQNRTVRLVFDRPRPSSTASQVRP